MSSFSSTSRTITFTRTNGNFSAFISCDKGDVYVDYEKDGDFNDTNYHPLFSDENPRYLELNIINSMGIEPIIDNVVWKVNGTNITDPSLSSAYVAQDNGRTLKIKGSIAALSGNQSIKIVAEATVTYADVPDVTIVRASYYIPVRQSSGNVYHVTIAATDDQSNYTINNGESITVKCLVFDPKGVEQERSQYLYKWYKIERGLWAEVTDDINVNLITIHRNQVDNQAMFKVEVYAPKSGGGYETEPLGFDTQMIYDALDEYTINVTPSKDEEIKQGSNGAIDYCISIFNQNKNCNASKAYVSFYLHAYGGVLAKTSAVDLLWDNTHSDATPSGNPTTYGPNTPMYQVNETDCINNGGALLTLDICARITEG